MPLEPFSLRREREAGYFDEEGNYVAYADAEAEDAWLRSLPRGMPFLSLWGRSMHLGADMQPCTLACCKSNQKACYIPWDAMMPAHASVGAC